MSSTGLSIASSTGVPHVGVCDMKLEVVTLPVSDVDRAKASTRALDGDTTPTSSAARTSAPS
jgi:hypothetical protein